MKVTAIWQRFIGADAAMIKELPAVVVSFGAEEGQVLQLALGLDDARDMICDLLTSLAEHGDEIAAEMI